MVALPNNDFWPRGDVISQRIAAIKREAAWNRRADDLMIRLDGISLEQFRRYANHSSRRHLVQDDFIYPVQPWLDRQEVLYQQRVLKPQPAKPVSPPIEHQTYHVYHLRDSEVPCNVFYSALCKVVNYVGSFYDCFRDAWHFAHA